ncbi:F-box domain-containing protein [Xylaria arbuscula]|nr:F-box domain-containing protein [Xylaria arbuscula]
MFPLLEPARPSNHDTKHVATNETQIEIQQQPQQSNPQACLGALPTELHILISKHLIYPDALSLKHTSRHFFYLVDTGVRLKVAWLMERRSLHLECPNDRRCDLRSDLGFCRGSVKMLMQRRREHLECESRPGLGCLVFGTTMCAHRPRGFAQRWARQYLRRRLTVEIWWILLAVLPAVLGVVWMLELASWWS